MLFRSPFMIVLMISKWVGDFKRKDAKRKSKLITPDLCFRSIVCPLDSIVPIHHNLLITLLFGSKPISTPCFNESKMYTFSDIGK